MPYPFLSLGFNSWSQKFSRRISVVNLLTSSRELDNAVWVKQKATVTADVITAPDGTLTPDLLTEDTTYGSHSCRQSVSLESGKTYKFSIFVKANSRDHVFLNVFDTSFNTVATTFDLTNETSAVATGSPTSHSITAISNGWYLISMTFTASATDTYQADTRLSIEGNWANRSYTGTGGSMYLWKAILSEVTQTLAPQTLAFLEYTTVPNTSSFTLRADTPYAVDLDYQVDWGDGTTDTYVGSTSAEEIVTHTYSTADTYVIKITPAAGTNYNPQFTTGLSDTSIAEIDGTGGASLTSLYYGWWGASNATSVSSNIDTSNVTDFTRAWSNFTSLTTFPVLDTSSGGSFTAAWQVCSDLTSFPELNFSSGTDFGGAWAYCSSLANFPANMFDNTGTMTGDWNGAFTNCALTVQSIENVLVSLDTNGVSNNILSIQGGSNANASTWTYSSLDAFINLINKGWTISKNGDTGIAYTINNSGTSFTLRSTGTVNYTVDWGDGSSLETSTSNTLSHTYSSSGTYVVKINSNSGATYRPFFNNSGDENQITSIAIGLVDSTGFSTDIGSAFEGSDMTKYNQVAAATSNVTTFRESWSNCSSLTSFPLIDTSSATTFRSAWAYCSSLTSFPLIDTSSATSLDYAWRNCSSLTSFPLIDTSSVQYFTSTWFSCSSLTSFPLIDTSSAIYLTATWSNCSSLTSFPLITTSSVTSFSSTWINCSSLTSFPLIDTSSGTSFSSAWYNCSLLTSFPLIDTSSGTNFSQAWRGCGDLTSFPLIDTSSGTNFYGAWYECYDLASFPQLNTSSATSLDHAWFRCSSLTSFPLIDTSNVSDFDSTWSRCGSLTSFPLIDTSSGTNFSESWYRCTSLTTFPLIDTSSGTRFDGAWDNCSSLTSFPLIDTSSGTRFDDAWWSCSSLTSFPLIDTSSGTRFDGAWGFCDSLTSFPQLNTSSGTNFYRSWYFCDSLTSFPTLDFSSGTYFRYAWRFCSSLTSFPANMFDNTGTLTSSAFDGCWRSCALTAQSIENILVSLDTNGASNILLDIGGGTNASQTTWSTAANTAYTNLINKGWTINYNA